LTISHCWAPARSTRAQRRVDRVPPRFRSGIHSRARPRQGPRRNPRAFAWECQHSGLRLFDHRKEFKRL